VGLSLYPKPTMSGTSTLKYFDSVGAIGNHLSAEAPIPCKRITEL
jgi:hypothetical protein